MAGGHGSKRVGGGGRLAGMEAKELGGESGVFLCVLGGVAGGVFQFVEVEAARVRAARCGAGGDGDGERIHTQYEARVAQSELDSTLCGTHALHDSLGMDSHSCLSCQQPSTNN